jgi:hypothetical protein
LPLDDIEELLAKSAAYRQASPILFGLVNRAAGRPLTPLHAGHLALLAVGSGLDGIFGSGENHHVAARLFIGEDRHSEITGGGVVSAATITPTARTMIRVGSTGTWCPNTRMSFGS